MATRVVLTAVLIGCACSYEPFRLDPADIPGEPDVLPAPCGTVSIYGDDFTDQVTAPRWGYRSFATNAVTFAESDGSAAFTIANGGALSWGWSSTRARLSAAPRRCRSTT